MLDLRARRNRKDEEAEAGNANFVQSLVHRAAHIGEAYRLRLGEAVPTTLEGAVQSLTAAVPPPREEFERQLQAALRLYLPPDQPTPRSTTA